MRSNVKLIIFFIGLIFLPTIVVGLVPEDITIWSEPAWATAGGGKVSIYVKVENASLGGALSGANILATVEGSEMGKFQKALQKTKSGISEPFIFIPSTRSGMAVLRFTVDYTVEKISYTTEKVYLQPIDHAAPSSLTYLEVNSVVPAGTITDLVVQYCDTYGNAIDNRYEEASSPTLIPEQVVFSDSTDGDGGFWVGSGYTDSIAVPVNDTGYATVKYRVATMGGDNILSIQGPPKVSPSVTFVVIKGIGAAPYAIQSQITPLTRTVYANNEDTFSLLYTVLDTYGNPVPGISFWRDTSLGEHERFVTNNVGKVLTTYGPKKSIESVDITAVVEGNPQISVTDTVQFVQPEAVMWELTASPQILASRDVNPTFVAEIRAKVMDSLGNPIAGETVTFSLIEYTNSTLLTTLPTLVSTTAVTDIDGYAIVEFLPGGFPMARDAAFDENATGTALVGASWKGRNKTIPITFRNYPYLRVETEISPMTIGINETIDVTVRLIGDGYALIAKPIDVVLVTDRSGSMLGDYPDRMIPVINASRTFAATMDISQKRDHVGLVSFGGKGWSNLTPRPYECNCYYSGGRRICSTCWDWSNVFGSWDWVSVDGVDECGTGNSYSASSTHQLYVNLHYPGNNRSYSDYAILEQPLSSSISTLNNSIDRMVPAGYTPMRYGIYRAIQEMIANSTRTDVIKAIVVLSDGDYNYYGDPLARGSGSSTTPCSNPSSYTDLTTSYCNLPGLNSSTQNLSNYAKSNNIKIFTIGYASDISSGGRNTLRILAESTGGKYYDGDATNIETIYKTIAGDLRRDAAAYNTEMILDFDMLNVTYDNTTTLMPGKGVFAYQYLDGTSTYISSWNKTVNPLPDHVPQYPYTIDQTRDWQQNPPQLKFSVGNITINQTWQTTFRLQVKVPGNIDIFGPNSGVWFGDEKTTIKYHVPIPTSFVTVIENSTVVVIPQQNLLELEGLSSQEEVCMGSRDLEFQWTLNYTGNQTVVQKVYYQSSENGRVWTGNWIDLTTIHAGTGPFDNKVFRVDLDTRDRYGYFNIKVIASEDLIGGLQDEWMGSPKLIKTCGCIQIT